MARWQKCIIFALLAGIMEATIFPDKKVKESKKLPVKTGPQNENVFERQLVESEPAAKDILLNNAAFYKDTAIRNFNGTVLGYVTPWNSHGYDVAKTFGKKFDIVSPVWLQIVKSKSLYEVQGTHDVDAKWMSDVRRRSVKIFPRVIVEKFAESDFYRLLNYQTEQIKFADAIIHTCKEYGFDGIVFEFWTLMAEHKDDIFLYIRTFIHELTKNLLEEELQLILVIPPMFNAKRIELLSNDIYAFSLLTYDYSNVQRPGANAPLYWIRRTIEKYALDKTKRHKFLMGLNMYGNDYTPDGGGPIVSNQYLELLSHVKKRLIYDENDVENFFEVRTNTGRHTVFYPTLYSINERIKLAQEMGVGIAIWELGQGLDYFYDLF